MQDLSIQQVFDKIHKRIVNLEQNGGGGGGETNHYYLNLSPFTAQGASEPVKNCMLDTLAFRAVICCDITKTITGQSFTRKPSEINYEFSFTSYLPLNISDGKGYMLECQLDPYPYGGTPDPSIIVLTAFDAQQKQVFENGGVNYFRTQPFTFFQPNPMIPMDVADNQSQGMTIPMHWRLKDYNEGRLNSSGQTVNTVVIEFMPNEYAAYSFIPQSLAGIFKFTYDTSSVEDRVNFLGDPMLFGMSIRADEGAVIEHPNTPDPSSIIWEWKEFSIRAEVLPQNTSTWVGIDFLADADIRIEMQMTNLPSNLRKSGLYDDNYNWVIRDINKYLTPKMLWFIDHVLRHSMSQSPQSQCKFEVPVRLQYVDYLCGNEGNYQVKDAENLLEITFNSLSENPDDSTKKDLNFYVQLKSYEERPYQRITTQDKRADVIGDKRTLCPIVNVSQYRNIPVPAPGTSESGYHNFETFKSEIHRVTQNPIPSPTGEIPVGTTFIVRQFGDWYNDMSASKTLYWDNAQEFYDKFNEMVSLGYIQQTYNSNFVPEDIALPDYARCTLRMGETFLSISPTYDNQWQDVGGNDIVFDYFGSPSSPSTGFQSNYHYMPYISMSLPIAPYYQMQTSAAEPFNQEMLAQWVRNKRSYQRERYERLIEKEKIGSLSKEEKKILEAIRAAMLPSEEKK